jgi:zinc and cadmium transporter
MISVNLLILLSVLGVSAVSLSGVFLLLLHQHVLKRILSLLVSFSTGALLGDVFLHMLPEMTEEEAPHESMWMIILIGILVSFILEKFLHWHHSHGAEFEEGYHHHPVGLMNLTGDVLHNAIDGLLIAGSYFISVEVGIATTFAVVLHEIPQEIGDIGVLLYSGYTKLQAVLFNLVTALSSLAAAAIVIALGSNSPSVQTVLIPLAVGNFLYIAGSDLIPELHKETAIGKSLMQVVGLIAGIVCMAAMLLLE